MSLKCHVFFQVIFAMCVSVLFAQDKIPLLENISLENLSGCLEINSILNRSTDHFDAIYNINDHIRADDLSKEADPYYYPTLQLLFSVNYTFENGIQAYVSTISQNKPSEGLSFGLFKEFTETSTLDMYFFTNAIWAWENPYNFRESNKSDKEADREQTFALLSGIGIKFEDIACTGICFDYKLCNIHFKSGDDDIGRDYRDLKRDGSIHAMGMGYKIYLNRNNHVTPFMYYVLGDIKGKSNRYSGYAAEISYKRDIKKYSVTVRSLFEHNKYKKIHPEIEHPGDAVYFSKKRDETVLTTELSFTWFDLPRYKNWYIRCGAGYVVTDSNIPFFDENSTYIGLGIGYFFG